MKELEKMPEIELHELAKIYKKRGVSKETAMLVVKELTDHNALEAHARDELGINEISQPKPLQAALASGASFIAGGILPLLVSLFAPIRQMIICQYIFSMLFLALCGVVAAKAGGSSIVKGIIRICFWGTIAMGVTALVGYLFGVKTGS